MKIPENDFDFEYYHHFTEEVIRTYIKEDRIQDSHYFWSHITRYQTLSEEFIREFKDNFVIGAWNFISMYKILSEESIEEFKDKVNWSYISIHQTLSEAFMIKNIDNIVIEWLGKNKKIPEEVKNRIIGLKRVRSL